MKLQRVIHIFSAQITGSAHRQPPAPRVDNHRLRAPTGAAIRSDTQRLSSVRSARRYLRITARRNSPAEGVTRALRRIRAPLNHRRWEGRSTAVVASDAHADRVILPVAAR